MSRQHIMLDLETLGISAGCVILSIGACVFDPYSDQVPAMGRFHRSINLDESIKNGFRIDAITLDWWVTLPKDTYKESTRDPASLAAVLGAFSCWFPEGAYVWGHGASFDQPILTAAYEKIGALPPWHFLHVRDTRTLFSLCEEMGLGYPKREKFASGTHHNAVDDAVTQALQVQWCYRQLEGKIK